MSEALLKPEKDFSKDADKLIPEAEALAKVGFRKHHLSENKANSLSRLMCKVRSISCWSWRSKHVRYDSTSSPKVKLSGFPLTRTSNFQASDLATTSRLLIAIVTTSKNSGDWTLLNDQVLLLSKKHAQLKQATTRMVQEVMKFLDDTPSLDVKLSVIETLRTVTEGKVSPLIHGRAYRTTLTFFKDLC